jgi:hypothetical protein
VNRGGVVVNVEGLPGFMPFSQMSKVRNPLSHFFVMHVCPSAPTLASCAITEHDGFIGVSGL